MAIPKPEPRDWQIANAQQLQITDREVLRLLRDSKKRVDEILKGLEGTSSIQRSQLMHTKAVLLAEQSKLFERLGDKVSALRADSASRAARLKAAADDALLRAVGKGAQSQFLYESALQVSQRAIDAAMARMRLSALPLSKRIYNTGVWMNGRLGRLINETLATGLDSKAFAKRARDWFSPNTPGGVRYAAMRLARTEINNAFHALSAEKYADTPWTTSVAWNLSKSHPKPDICNELAADSPFDKNKVPARPHPQCMCYITANYEEEDDFVDNFLKGDYDEYLDKELAKNGWDEPEPDPVKQKAQTIEPKPAATKPLPKTQQHALDVFQSGMTRDEWAAAGANVNAIDQLGRKGFTERLGTKTAYAQGKPYQAITYKLTKEKLKSQVEPLTGQAALKSVPKGLPKRGSLTPAQRKSLKVYESAAFVGINSALRSDREGGPDVRNINSAMDESVLPESIEVWRGMNRAESLFGDRLAHDLTGFSWQEKAYSSTSTEERVAKQFVVQGANNPTGDVLIRVSVPAGTKAVQISDEFGGNQAEILLQSNTKWTIIKDNGIDDRGFRRLDVEAVGVPALERDDSGRAGTDQAGSGIQPDPRGTQEPQGSDSAPEPLTGKVALDSIPKGLFKRGSMDPKQRKALETYESGWFSVINGFLRGGSVIEDDLDKEDAATIAQIDSAMAESLIPADIQLWRGMFQSQIVFGDDFDGDLTGFSWHEKGYGSLTANESLVKEFNVSGTDDPKFKGKNSKFKVTVSAGVKALLTSTFEEGSKTNGPQAEITLQHDLKWTVVKDNGFGPDGVRQLEIRVDPIGEGSDRVAADKSEAGSVSQPDPQSAKSEAAGTPAKLARRDDPVYKRDYNRGWKRRGSGVNDLTSADRRGEPDAFYDGFSDRSIGMPKWTRADERDEAEGLGRQLP